MTRANSTIVIIAGLALTGALTVLLATRFGIGVTPDSTVYLEAARNLAQGPGLVVFTGKSLEPQRLTHYPPLYPVALALGLGIGESVEGVARWLTAILFGANIFLVGFLLASMARSSFWLPVVGALLALTAPDLLQAHSSALSEPLYMLLLLTGLLFLDRYLEKRSIPLLLGAACALALSVLTRYVGVAAIMTGVAALLILGRTKLRHKLIAGTIFGILAGAPMFFWALRNHLATGGASDRQWAFHPVKLSQAVPAFSAMAQWLLVGKVRGDVRVAAFLLQLVVLAGFTLYWFSVRRATRHVEDDGQGKSHLPHLLLLFVGFHILFLIFTASFVDADTVFDSRSLLPVHYAGLILFPWLAAGLYRRAGRPGVRYAIMILTLLLVCSYAFRGVNWLRHVQADAQGYASRAWKNSGIIEEIKGKQFDERPIYSNGFEGIYYLTGRRALSLPEKVIHGTGRPNLRYEEELDKIAHDLSERSAVIVYFNTLPERSFFPLESELSHRLRLVNRSWPDGSILTSPEATSRAH